MKGTSKLVEVFREEFSKGCEEF